MILKSTYRALPLVWTVACLLLFCGLGCYFYYDIGSFSFLSIVLIGFGVSSLLWFLTLKTVIITNHSFIMTWLFLPKKEEFHFNEIERVSHDKFKYEAEIGSDGSSQQVTLHTGRQLLIYLKSEAKVVSWSTYTFANYEELVKALKQARKEYKGNVRRVKSKNNK